MDIGLVKTVELVYTVPAPTDPHVADKHCYIALAHNRLAIVDLNPEGEQPFHDADGNIHAVVNGELYGYEEVHDRLSRSGYQFKSQSDSEIALALYKEHGLSFLSYLRGEFSLCLYDSEKKLFIAACDRYAIKPMYYTIVDGKLLVSTTVLPTLSKQPRLSRFF